VPLPDPAAERARAHVLLRGEIPSPLKPPSGCAFRTRCPEAIDACAQARPAVMTSDVGHTQVACIRRVAAMT
jgi:oligopeptide transport system ATP-binding protein